MAAPDFLIQSLKENHANSSIYTFRMTDNNDNSSPGSHTNHILTIELELGVEGGYTF
jgi:hypothetical protein